MALSCEESRENIGVSRCKKAPSFIKGMITTPSDFTITAADAITQAAWQTAITDVKSARVYLWPNAVNYENISEEQVVEETSITVMDVRPGNYRHKLFFKENLEQHKAMYSHRNNAGKVFLIDIENKIISTSDDDGITLRGFTMDNLLVEKLMLNDGTGATKTPVGVYLSDNTELDQRGQQVEAPFINSLIALTTVVLATTGVPIATEIVVTVKSKLDNEAIEGLVAADFVLLTAAGASQSISGAVEAPGGTYTLSGAAWVTGTLTLVAASALSIDAFEAEAAIIVTI